MIDYQPLPIPSESLLKPKTILLDLWDLWLVCHFTVQLMSNWGTFSFIFFQFVFVAKSFSRRLAQDLSHSLITTLQQECTCASCPEVKAREWLYLCVAHGNDGATEVWLYLLRVHDFDFYDLFISFLVALLCHRLYSTYHRQCDCLVKLAANISFQVCIPSSVMYIHIS